MTTPRKSEIEKHATELYVQECYRSGHPELAETNPTRQELSQDGFLQAAQSELMRDRAKTQIEEWKNYNETEYCESLEDFPVEAIAREGSFVVGGRGCGKTNLLKILVQRMINRKIRVKVLDSCLAWKGYPLPTVRVKKLEAFQKWNTIYDLSRLSVLEARELVSKMMARDVQEAIALTDAGVKPKCVYVLEEAQNLIPSNSLRAKRFMEISRFVTQGRNFGLSYVCSTQRLSSVDINLIEISGVRYWFKLEGHRSLVKARYWLDKYTVWRLRDLPVGSGYLQIGSNIKLLELPLWSQKELKVTA